MRPRPRVALIVALGVALAAPLLLQVLSVVRSPSAWRVWLEAERLGGLLGTTAALAVLSCLVAVPAGTLLALAVERLPLRGRTLLRLLLLVGVFLPLPVHAVAWQVVLGTWLPPLSLAPGEVAWRPWNRGLLPAAWVHGVAGIPWAAWIVGAGLRAADRALEEDALLTGGPWAVLRRVLLPRAVLGSVLACGWLTAQAATEIPVTDAMMVRTFAEETYTRFVSGGDGVAEALACTLPVWAAAVVGCVILGRPIARRFDEAPSEALAPRMLKFGTSVHTLGGVVVWLAVGLVTLLPLAALVWKAAGGGTREGVMAAHLAAQLAKVIRTDGTVLVGNMLSSLAVGFLAAGLAWAACWGVSRSRFGRRVLFVLCVVLWLTPGPVIGLGLLDAIRHLLDAEDWLLAALGAKVEFPPLRSLLYDQPSPVPAGWASVLRFFPIAVVVVWPAVRAVPRNLLEAVTLDGFGWRGEWRLVVAPLTGVAFLRASLAVAALALGEVSATKIVNPPFRGTFILRLFDQMHYGAEATVAALCLLQVAATALVAAGFLWFTEKGR